MAALTHTCFVVCALQYSVAELNRIELNRIVPHISRFNEMTEHSMHLVYTPKLIFISFYCHFLWSLCGGVLVVCYICGHVDCPYSHNAIIIHFIHVALFSASPYILLYFIEIISLLSFPFYLYNAYILFAFISMFRSVLLIVYVCMHVCCV